MTDFESYIRQGEPGQRERANNWSIAIGLQAVDGLTPSEYLINSARENIEGHISLDEVRQRINAYYQSKEGRELEAKEAGKEEADKVSENITRLLSEQTFALNVASFANIHRRIFAGVMKHAGEFRKYNISKKEWVLDGESVIYAPYELLAESLEYDFEQERKFDYSKLSDEERLNHLMHFIAGIWQIHPFAEGNTRTTAVFTIFYLRKFGYKLNNEPFAQYSLFFRNALVRANYDNHSIGIVSTYEPLTHFFRYILFGEKQELRNRHLHIRAAEILPQNTNTGDKNNEIGDKSAINPEIGDKKQQILAFISSHGEVKADDVAKHIGLGASRTRDYLKQLVEEGKLLAMGANKNRTYKLR